VSRSAANSFAVLSSLDSAGPESAADVKTPERAAVFGPAFLREAVLGAFRLLPHKGHRSSLFFFLIFLLLLISGLQSCRVDWQHAHDKTLAEP
jgi:hypothetical protein